MTTIYLTNYNKPVNKLDVLDIEEIPPLVEPILEPSPAPIPSVPSSPSSSSSDQQPKNDSSGTGTSESTPPAPPASPPQQTTTDTQSQPAPSSTSGGNSTPEEILRNSVNVINSMELSDVNLQIDKLQQLVDSVVKASDAANQIKNKQKAS